MDNPKLNREQLTDLKELLAERIVDNMSTKELVEYVMDDMFKYFDKQDEHDFYEDCRNYWIDDEQFEEIVNDVKSWRSGWDAPPWGGGFPHVKFCYSMPIYSLIGHIFDYNKRVQTKFIQLIMQFLYVDISDYPVTNEGIYQACYDEVVAEATDTGDLPMYGQKMLNQAAQWKYEDFLNDIKKMVG